MRSLARSLRRAVSSPASSPRASGPAAAAPTAAAWRAVTTLKGRTRRWSPARGAGAAGGEAAGVAATGGTGAMCQEEPAAPPPRAIASSCPSRSPAPAPSFPAPSFPSSTAQYSSDGAGCASTAAAAAWAPGAAVDPLAAGGPATRALDTRNSDPSRACNVFSALPAPALAPAPAQPAEMRPAGAPLRKAIGGCAIRRVVPSGAAEAREAKGRAPAPAPAAPATHASPTTSVAAGPVVVGLGRTREEGRRAS